MIKRRRLTNIINDEADLMEVDNINIEESSKCVLSLVNTEVPSIVQLAYEISAQKPVELVERNDSLIPSGKASQIFDNMELLQLNRYVSQADEKVRAKVKHKLELLAEQMAYLQKQALQILREGSKNIELNHAACNFRKVPENIYHLYQRPSGQRYFSVLSPEDWNNSPPHPFCGSYRFKKDSSWEAVTKFESS